MLEILCLQKKYLQYILIDLEIKNKEWLFLEF